MSSLELAHAIIWGSSPERRVSAEWHKGGSYTVTLLQQEADTPVWHDLQTWHPVDQKAALRQFVRVVEAQWQIEETRL